MNLTSSRFPSPLPGGHLLCTSLCAGGTWDRGAVLGHQEFGVLGPYFLLLACPPLCPGGQSCPTRGHEADCPAGDGRSRQRASAALSPRPPPLAPRGCPGTQCVCLSRRGPAVALRGTVRPALSPRRSFQSGASGSVQLPPPSLGLCRGPQAIDTVGSLAGTKPSPQSPPQEAASVCVSG